MEGALYSQTSVRDGGRTAASSCSLSQLLCSSPFVLWLAQVHRDSQKQQSTGNMLRYIFNVLDSEPECMTFF